jgi:hypothetical protein
VNNKIEQLIEDVKEELGLLLSISFGIFLFALFFQPFPFIGFDFDKSLLFVGGSGTIVFLIMVLIRITIPRVLRRNNQESQVLLLPKFFSGFIIIVLSSVAFVFYLGYVGLVKITFSIIFKDVKPLILFSTYKVLTLGLWDEAARRMISFRKIQVSR